MSPKTKASPFAEVPKRVLVVVAHPDDAEFGCAGTVAKWAQEGSSVFYLICTNGNKGSSDRGMTNDKLASLRETEQKDAASVLGVKNVTFLEHPDGELEDNKVTRGQVVREIRKIKPNVIITSDIYGTTFYQHRDHRKAGRLALDSCYPYARDHLHYPEHIEEGLETHKVESAFLAGLDGADVFVSIEDTIELKIQALLKHATQVEEDRIKTMIKEWGQNVGEKAGLKYAESFRRIDFRP